MCRIIIVQFGSDISRPAERAATVRKQSPRKPKAEVEDVKSGRRQHKKGQTQKGKFFKTGIRKSPRKNCLLNNMS